MIKKIILYITITNITLNIIVKKLEKDIIEFKMGSEYKFNELLDLSSHFQNSLDNNVTFPLSKNEFMISQIPSGVDQIFFSILKYDDGLNKGDFSCLHPILFYSEINEFDKDDYIPYIIYDKEEKSFIAFNILATNYESINNLEINKEIDLEENEKDEFVIIVNNSINYAAITYCLDEFKNDEEEYIFKILFKGFAYETKEPIEKTLTKTENITKNLIFSKKTRNYINTYIQDPYEILISNSNLEKEGIEIYGKDPEKGILNKITEKPILITSKSYKIEIINSTRDDQIINIQMINKSNNFSIWKIILISLGCIILFLILIIFFYFCWKKYFKKKKNVDKEGKIINDEKNSKYSASKKKKNFFTFGNGGNENINLEDVGNKLDYDGFLINGEKNYLGNDKYLVTDDRRGTYDGNINNTPVKINKNGLLNSYDYNKNNQDNKNGNNFTKINGKNEIKNISIKVNGNKEIKNISTKVNGKKKDEKSSIIVQL